MRLTKVVGGAFVFVAFGLGASPVVVAQTEPTTTTTAPEQTATTTAPGQATIPPTAATTAATTPATPEPRTTDAPVVATQPAQETVTYCHATGSVLDPYDLDMAAAGSIIGQGHSA